MEEQLLAGLLRYPETAMLAIPLLRRDDFTREENQVIFSAIYSLYERGVPVDTVTVAYTLIREEQDTLAGGYDRLHHLRYDVACAEEDVVRLLNGSLSENGLSLLVRLPDA